jgi:hypothetical protein
VELLRLQTGQSSTKRNFSTNYKEAFLRSAIEEAENAPELINFMADNIEVWVGYVCFLISL